MNTLGPMRRRLSSSVELPCPFCGELGSVFLDEGGGERQTYVEDCGVCCRPRIVHVEHDLGSRDPPRVWLERDE